MISSIPSGADSTQPSTDSEAIAQPSQTSGRFKSLGGHIGEFVWLMGQSPIHRELSIKDLDWLLMPAIVLQQYKIFYDDNQKPIGAALWAYLSPEAEENFKVKGKIEAGDWGNDAKVDPAKGLIRQEGGTLWLIELLAPFHSSENKHRELIVQDLMNTALKGQRLKMVHINPASQKKETIEFN